MISIYPLGLVAVILFAIGFGVVASGYVVAILGGLRTDMALMKWRASKDVGLLHSRIDELAKKLP